MIGNFVVAEMGDKLVWDTTLKKIVGTQNG